MNEEKSARAITKVVGDIAVDLVWVAKILDRTHSHAITVRMFELVRAIVHLWAIDYRTNQYPPDLENIYRWADESDRLE